MINTPIKIQGKKTKLIPRIMFIANNILDTHPDIDTWVEPFLGSGVVAFNCPNKIRKVIVNDINPHIIKFYESINKGIITGDLIEHEFTLHSANLKQYGYDYYNEVKDRFNETFDSLDFLFLTRTGFNGVMRFNKSGKWNVPFCKLNIRLSDDVIKNLIDNVNDLEKLFNNKEFIFYNKSFEDVIESAPKESIFYCDPPYYGLNTNYYANWNENQEILLNNLLKDRTFIYSTWINDGHKDNDMIDKLWSKYNIDNVEHKYNVASNSNQRMDVIEGLIYTDNKIDESLW